MYVALPFLILLLLSSKTDTLLITTVRVLINTLYWNYNVSGSSYPHFHYENMLIFKPLILSP